MRLIAISQTQFGDFVIQGEVVGRCKELTAAWEDGITEEEARIIGAELGAFRHSEAPPRNAVNHGKYNEACDKLRSAFKP